MSRPAVAEVIELIKKSHESPLAKAGFNTFEPSSNPTIGPKFYNLDGIVQQLYPVVTPLLKMIPRNKTQGGNALNFKQITAVNPSSFFSGGVEGRRGKVIDFTFVDKTVKFVTSILENQVTWQGELASQGLNPQARAMSAQTLINAFLIDEHKNVVGANGNVALGTTGTPVLVGSTTGGTLAAATWSVIAVALTPEAARRSSVALGVALTANQTNADGSVVSVPGGYAIPSAAASAVTTGSTSSITAAAPWTPGAFAYAWYIGAAGSEKLTAITATNKYVFTAANGAGQLASALSASDQSVSPLRFDGLLTQICAPGSGSIVSNLAGATLTADGAGGVVEINAVLAQAWDQFKVSYTHILVSGQMRKKINTILLASPAGSGAARIEIKGGNAGATVGTFITGYLNPVTGNELDLVSCPDLPDGVILFYSDSIPYSLPDGVGPIEMKMLADYYQIEWPMITLSYDIAVATYGTLIVRFTPGFGLIANVG